MKLRDNENVLVLGVFLGVTALISALVLALVSQLTAAPIQSARTAAANAALKQLRLPEFDNAPSAEVLAVKSAAGFPVEFMAARRGQRLVGVAAKVTNPHGYSGKLELLIGFAPDGKILAVLVTEHSETPGLGANVCERKFRRTIANFTAPVPKGLPRNPILDQFTGRVAPEQARWAVKKDGGEFEFKTGATVTSRAIVAAVAEAGAAFAAHRAEINKRFGGVK